MLLGPNTEYTTLVHRPICDPIGTRIGELYELTVRGDTLAAISVGRSYRVKWSRQTGT